MLTFLPLLVAWVLTAPNPTEEIPIAASPREVEPGQTRLLTSGKGMRYFLRVPASYDAKKGARVVVFMHGSNMNGLTYLRSFEAKRWAADAILVCPNGETGDQTYGANNFTFGSAPFVAEVTEEVLSAFRSTRVYIGGHSQGGFVTYSVIMHYPDLFHGAFPMAGDCWSQNEPNLWETKPDLVAKQKKIAIAVIHGQADPVVAFSQGQHAFDVFNVMGYPKLRLFAPKHLGHQFMLSPVAEALEWLDAVTGLAPDRATKLASRWVSEGEWGWVTAVAAATGKAKLSKASSRKRKAMIKNAEKAAKKALKGVAKRMEGRPAREWLPLAYEYRRLFGSTKAARKFVNRFDRVRAEQRQLGETLFSEARGHFQNSAQAEGYTKLERLLAEAPYSYYAYYALSWLDQRDAETKKGS
ncbi:MAG: hypothetical protein AAF488_00185 [Planctomycetota bacterium]